MSCLIGGFLVHDSPKRNLTTHLPIFAQPGDPNDPTDDFYGLDGPSQPFSTSAHFP
jgi:hypothetical protein